MELELGKAFLPDYPVPDGMTMESISAQCPIEGWTERLSVIDADAAEGRRRCEQTLPGASGFRARHDHPDGLSRLLSDRHGLYPLGARARYPGGPGRGSGAGSLVAYALEITDLDPLEYELLFERFLNPERVSMPDFDVDFCMESAIG